METSIDIPATSFSTASMKNKLQDVSNRPMTLVGPSKTNSINSNGYLPKDFSISYDKSIKETSSKELTSDTPTVLYSLGNGKSRIRGTTITNVTDFVKKEGYGTYYGYNIPTKSDIKNAADVASGWKLIVIEEDPTMSFRRSGVLELGLINSNKEVIQDKNINLSLNLNNYTTPIAADFDAQLFFSSVGSNPQAKQYQVQFDAEGEALFSLKTRDFSGSSGNINRYLTSESFGQNIITVDGQRRKDMSSYRTAPSGVYNPLFSLNNYQNNPMYTDGMDIELLNITNEDPKFDTNVTAKHNAYIKNKAKGITLNIFPSPDGDNFITALGIMTQVETPTFTSSITHVSLETGESAGDLGTEELLEIKATAKNMTASESTIKGVSDTRVVISLDDSLDISWDTLNLTFLNDGNNGSYFTRVWTVAELNEKASTTYFIDEENKEILVNFGTTEQFYSSYADLEQKIETDVYSYNNAKDELQMTVTARTSSKEKKKLENNLKITAKDFINIEDVIVSADETSYCNTEDRFSTYIRDVYLHLRQLVIQSTEFLTVPGKNFGTILCSNSVAIDNAATEFRVETDSSIREDTAFLSTTIRYSLNNSQIDYAVLIPQNYELEGYVISNKQEEQSIDNIVKNISFEAEPSQQYWITVYIKPSSTTPTFHHWDYKKNELGKIANPIK